MSRLAPEGVSPPFSVGIDVSSVERVRQLVNRRPEFLTKYFTVEEAEYCAGRPERLAARWAAKEAVRKVFGGLGWTIPLYSRIAVVRRPGGSPTVLVDGQPVAGLAISLTHDAGLGMAVAALSPLGRRSRWLWGELPSDLQLPARPEVSHKGTFGTVVVIAGSPQFPGAAILCSLGALRGGAGKVKVLAHGTGLVAAPPELIRVPVDAAESGLGRGAVREASATLQSADAIVCGPGLGESQATRELLEELFQSDVRSRPHLVLDADALNVCAGQAELRRQIPPGSVLTPHPLEASRMAGVDVQSIERDRVSSAQALASELGVVLVLKGAGTVVADPQGRTWVDGHATSVLATGGTGDVLAGLIGAMLAQGLDPYEAARAGVFVHGEAGTRLSFVRGRAGILASEVADALVEAQESVRRQQEAARPDRAVSG
ncbi:MAG: NAD(P)H-hydrate dehydratase [Candidatus Dormiibacterota bacterium]